jgi:hypothetical protein
MTPIELHNHQTKHNATLAQILVEMDDANVI